MSDVKNTFKGTKERAAEYVAARLQQHLDKGEKVLWLVPGGSGLEVAAAAAAGLRPPLDNLTITLTDERYGPPSHPDSNWYQLMATGFKLPGAKLHPVLNGQSLETTAGQYSRDLEAFFNSADYSLALVGIGADGHALGIKPHSPAATAKGYAAGYEWEDFTRLTATARAVARLDEAVVYAVGQGKHPQLTKLKQTLPPEEQPAQVLKQAGKLVIFSDYEGEAL